MKPFIKHTVFMTTGIFGLDHTPKPTMIRWLCIALLAITVLVACGSGDTKPPPAKDAKFDTATFDTNTFQ